MKVAIVDKLSDDTLNLQNFISKYCDSHQIMAEVCDYPSVEILLRENQRQPASIIFLSTDPPGPLDGLETARRIHSQNKCTLVVFLASTKDRAVEAFEVRAFDYLLIPYSYSRFEMSMDACVTVLAAFQDIANYIIVKESRRQVRILLSDIIYTDYYNHYIQIHAAGRTIRSYMSFNEFSPKLLKYPRFLCCYRNCIINMDHVALLDSHDFLLDTGERIPITRKLRAELKQAYTDYQFYKSSVLYPMRPTL